MNLRVLMYHSISSARRGRMTVSEAELVAHLVSLQSDGFRFVTLEEAVTLIAGTPPDMSRGEEALIHIMFDDGYRSTITRAMPILRSFGIPASVAVCSSYLSGEFEPSTLPHEEKDMMTWDDLG